MQITTTKLALKRLAFLVASAAITAVLSWATGEYQTTVAWPIIYLVLTTARDYLDKTIPNK